jgi:hypothetical protein
MNTIHSFKEHAITFQTAETQDMILAAKHLCHDVYLEVGFIKTPYDNRIVPYEHDNSSSYLVALDSKGEVVGTVRLKHGAPFQTMEIWKDNLYTPCSKLISDAIAGNSSEIGALAVRKDFRGKQVSCGLYKAAYIYSLSSNVDYAIISMDAMALHSMQALGWNVIKIGDPMYYFGSLTVPGIMPVNEQPEHIAYCDLKTHELLVA